MKTVPANLATHLAGDALSLCTLWTITRLDAVVHRLTDHDNDVSAGGFDFSSAVSYTHGAIAVGVDGAADNVEISAIIDPTAITAADLRARLYDGAQVQIEVVNWQNPAGGTVVLAKGELSAVSLNEPLFKAEFRGLANRLRKTIGRLYLPSCDATLFDTRCGVSDATWKATGTVTSVTSRAVFTDTARTEANDHWKDGKVVWTSGDNDNREMDILTSTSAGVITLYEPMSEDIAVSDGYEIFPGCDKTKNTCRDRFSNITRMRGCPYIQGMKRLLRDP